eukprot:s2809_g5.t3
MWRTPHWLGIATALQCVSCTEIKVAGSSTVFPVANAWANGLENASNFAITIEGGGSSSGARRVCKDRTDPDHVDIGDMSRNWKSSEALLLDDDYTWECSSSKIRVTQIQVGTDGLAVDIGGIAYFGYAYYAQYANQLTDTADAKVEPSTYTITDGSYSVYKRRLFMNVDNEAWDRVHPFLGFGFSSAGQIDERGNEEADYVSIAPSSCPVGAELSAVPYVNQFGNNKINYTCSACPLGRFKFLDTPTACTSCESGRYTDQVGQSSCSLCDLGYEAVNGSSCRACSPGFYKGEAAAAFCSPCIAGMFNNQSAQASCNFCSPGSFAPEGSTQCFDCPLNEIAPVPGSATCSYCGEGFTTTQMGSTACRRCRAGSYRSSEQQCVECPDGKTTAFQGAILIGDCICPSGQFLRDGLTGDSLEAMASGSCADCGEGLSCGLGSDLRIYASFLAGEEMAPEEQLFPLLEEGYFATPQEPTQVYKCGASAHCPGGLPGTCAEGRIEIPCGRCQVGTKFEAGACRQCSSMDNLLFFSGAVAMGVAIPVFYYFMNSPVTAKASTMLSTTMAFGMTLTLLQTIGLVGLVSLSWPSYMQPLTDFVSIFMLDLESLNFDCVGVSSPMRYAVSVLCWPAALGWLVICGLLSKLGPRKLHFARAKAISTLGQLFQMGFTIIAKTALMPFMCYSHPNGKSSVLRFSDVICWEEQTGHTVMVTFGVIMTGTMVFYWCTLLWATIQAPKRSARADMFFLQATRFLFFRFRTDYWWYGTWFILRGPLLSLPVVIFTDLPQVQLFVMTAVVETYMVLQLMTWPWKTPLINLADGAMSMMMILLLSIGAAFLDALEGQVKATYSSLAVGVLGILYGIAFVLLSLVVLALVHKTAMGSAGELPILTLGHPPSNDTLRQALDALHTTYEEADSNTIEKAIDELNVYDRRMLATVLTTLGPYFTNDHRMRLMNRLSVSTVSLPSVKAEVLSPEQMEHDLQDQDPKSFVNGSEKKGEEQLSETRNKLRFAEELQFADV